ncbi:hypothetical protein ACJ73_02254 [Blastomyces percursus]|uniref:Uncharacterized protein n=1 Tax=Blastomyces percursus TaxID=1658174 RepID=A0A1J9QCU9_9EURO|nr:hypothetical protein ACJ73_02254 [Blastomyces percursus]
MVEWGLIYFNAAASLDNNARIVSEDRTAPSRRGDQNTSFHAIVEYQKSRPVQATIGWRLGANITRTRIFSGAMTLLADKVHQHQGSQWRKSCRISYVHDIRASSPNTGNFLSLPDSGGATSDGDGRHPE